ncbi:MAG: hypothetical protein FWG94_06250 [Oscillospiraceae bacterium]|nr:hypothetical protein [Oscillospiraceae bacterium]
MKKITSVLLTAVMMMGMIFTASATVASSGIRGINEKDFQNALKSHAEKGRVTVAGKAVRSMSDLASLRVLPGSEIRIPLTPNMFLRADGTPLGTETDVLTAAQLRTGRITVRAAGASADNIAFVELVSSRSGSYISVEFDRTPTTQVKRFNFSIFLHEGGTRRQSTRIDIRGSLAAEIYDVDSRDNFMDISDGRVLRAVTNVRNIELELGENISVRANLTRGMRYAGIALINEYTERDELVFRRNPTVGSVYRLQTINLRATGGTVRIDTGRATFYVYNTNGAYLGTTRENLPFWTTYYLSSRRVDSLRMS